MAFGLGFLVFGVACFGQNADSLKPAVGGKKKITGKYIRVAASRHEKLKLKKKHDYIYTLITPDERHLTSSGKWSVMNDTIALSGDAGGNGPLKLVMRDKRLCEIPRGNKTKADCYMKNKQYKKYLRAKRRTG